MKQFSYSKVDCFKRCPFQFGLRYLEKIKMLPNQDANNALYLGVAIHTGLEENSIKQAIRSYFSNYYCVNDLHHNEVIKLENMLGKTLKLLEKINQDGELVHEYEINTYNYKGYVDLIVQKDNGLIDIYDYKYSNNVDSYMKSSQLHVYKYYLEQLGYKVDKMYYLFIPKTQIRQKKNESLLEFRQRLKEILKDKEPFIQEVIYDPNKVIDFTNGVIDIFQAESFEKKPTDLCSWCEYYNYCQKGDTTDMLPQAIRREKQTSNRKRIWCYAPPFSGKTTTFDACESPLMLNTDGNINEVTAPYLSIKDQVEMVGRVKKTTLAWDYFKDIVDELEKGQHEFKTLIIDLIEDIYEHCRIWGCQKLGLDHESDQATKAYDYVRSEFLRTMRRLMNLDIETIVLLSHMDISKNIFKANGDNITRIAPSINEKVANKLAGMVDFVTRIEIERDSRYFAFKTDDVTFGGGRLKNVTVDKIPLSWDALCGLYESPAPKKKPVTDEPTQANESNEQTRTRRTRTGE